MRTTASVPFRVGDRVEIVRSIYTGLRPGAAGIVVGFDRRSTMVDVRLDNGSQLLFLGTELTLAARGTR